VTSPRTVRPIPPESPALARMAFLALPHECLAIHSHALFMLQPATTHVYQSETLHMGGRASYYSAIIPAALIVRTRYRLTCFTKLRVWSPNYIALAKGSLVGQHTPNESTPPHCIALSSVIFVENKILLGLCFGKHYCPFSRCFALL
jgi:hypothetical protein